MAITATHLLTAGTGDNEQTQYTTASISPTANRLVLLTIVAIRDATLLEPTITGGGMTTWTLVRMQQIVNATVYVFRSLQASPTSGTITMSWGAQSIYRAAWSINEFAGVDTGGTNGANAVVTSQYTTQRYDAAASTSIEVAMAAFSHTGNATFGVLGCRKTEAITPGTGFTELGEVDDAAGTTIQTQWRNDNHTPVDWSYSSASADRVAIGVELKALPSTIKKALGSDYADIKRINKVGNNSIDIEKSSLRADSDLAAYWRFEDDGLDETANNNDLTLVNAPAYATGKFGKCLDFELSSSQGAYVSSQTGLDTPSSIVCWINMESGGVDRHIIGKWDSTDNQRGWQLFVGSDEKIYFDYSSDGGGTNYTRTLSDYTFKGVDLGRWLQIAVTCVPATKTVLMYINATAMSTTQSPALATSIYTCTKRVEVGYRRTNVTDASFFDGKIDDLTVFNNGRILTATEISNLYYSNVKKYLGVA